MNEETQTPLLTLTIAIRGDDAADPRIAGVVRSIVGALAPVLKVEDLEELQAAVDDALLMKRLEAPPQKRRRKEPVT